MAAVQLTASLAGSPKSPAQMPGTPLRELNPESLEAEGEDGSSGQWLGNGRAEWHT